MRFHSPFLVAAAFASTVLLVPAIARAGDVHALTEDGRLVTFDDAAPGTLTSDVTVTGLSAQEVLIALDVHPCDGRIFALSDQDRVYTLDPATGASTVSSALTSPLGSTLVGGAFDPVSLLWRVVDESGGNRTIDVDTGAVTPELQLHFDTSGPDDGRTPFVSALAYAGGVFLGVDTDLDELILLDPAGDGTLARIGRLGIDAAAPVGLDFRSGDETLFASVNVGGLSGLYSVDSTTGHIRFMGTIGDGTPISDVAAAPTPFAPLAMDKLDLKFNFKKSGKDMVHIRGQIQTPVGDYAGIVATVDVGGVMRSFTLESNGKGTTGGDTFHLEGKPKDGLVKYDVKFKKGDFADDFADEGMDGTEAAKKEERRIVVVIELDGATYASEATVSYTAKVGKEGNAKLISTSAVGSLPGNGCPPPPMPPAPYVVELKGNKNTVTLAIGDAGGSPFEVRDNNSTVTVFVPSDMSVTIVISGNKNDVAVPAELADSTSVDDRGNNNSVTGLN